MQNLKNDYLDRLVCGYWYDSETRTELLFDKSRSGAFSRPVDKAWAVTIHQPPHLIKKQENWFEGLLPDDDWPLGVDAHMRCGIEHILSLFVFGVDVRYWLEEWPETNGNYVPLDTTYEMLS